MLGNFDLAAKAKLVFVLIECLFVSFEWINVKYIS